MMLIQYIIDEPPKNTSNGRGNWILHLKEKQSLKQGGAIESAFDWDTKSQLRIHFHRFAARNMPMDDDGLAIAFKPVRDGLIDSLSQYFGQKFDDGNQDLFHFVYSQCKAPDPVFADTILVTIDHPQKLSPSPYSSVVMRWGYIPSMRDKASLIATLGELRATRIAEIVAELKWSKAGTKKVDKLKKELAKTQKAIAHCVAETVFN
jgi:hypothetical protein